jgi:CubicO group peptidase (beta-lactamase class C family)
MMSPDRGLTRRGWLGAAGVAALVAGTASRAATTIPDFHVVSRAGGHDYTPALRALSAYAATELDAVGLPGMTLCVTDAEGFTATLGLGWADVERRVPVNAHQLFQIGSISKSFIALTVLALADQGRIDLDAPVGHYLPEAALPPAPITVAQLLSHTSGMAHDAPEFPRGGDGRLWTGFAPGTKFSYSNIGFILLGRVIERVTGEPHQIVVDRLVRQKLGIQGMAGVISNARRPDFAVGYWPWDNAHEQIPGARLEKALWSEEDMPSGSVGADSEEMAIYLRTLIQLGRGSGSPLLSDAMAKRFATPVVASDEDFGPGSFYACGVAIQPVDGAPCLHHTGGMMSFSSSFHADPAAGVACFASVNARLGSYRPRQTTAYAIRLMRAARRGDPPPPPPDPLKPWHVQDPAIYTGTFHSTFGDGRAVISMAPDGGLIVTANGTSGKLLRIGKDRLATDNPALSRFALDIVRGDNAMEAFWWGSDYFGTRFEPPEATDSPRIFAGTYLNRDPWVGQADIHARATRLYLEGGGWLVERGGWWSLEGDPGGVERYRFDAMLNGQTRRLNVSGSDLERVNA